MGLLDTASNVLEDAFWVAFWFSIFATVLFTGLQYVTGVDFFPYTVFSASAGVPTSTDVFATQVIMAFNRDYIDSFVNSLRAASENQVDVIKAVLTMLPTLLPIYVKILTITITLVAMMAGFLVGVTLTFMLLPPTTVSLIVAAVEWGTVLYIALGIIMEIARLIYTLLPFGGGSS